MGVNGTHNVMFVCWMIVLIWKEWFHLASVWLLIKQKRRNSEGENFRYNPYFSIKSNHAVALTNNLIEFFLDEYNNGYVALVNTVMWLNSNGEPMVQYLRNCI